MNTFLPMRNVYSCSVKIRVSGSTNSGKAFFSILRVVEAFSLQNVVEMLEKVVSWREVR